MAANLLAKRAPQSNQGALSFNLFPAVIEQGSTTSLSCDQPATS